MNLILRMLAVLLASYFKPRLPVEKPVNSLSLRVLPNDLDINLHMNNGRYLIYGSGQPAPRTTPLTKRFI